MHRPEASVVVGPAPSAGAGLCSGEHVAPYRPDVDGLRAIAVLSVVLFHAGVTGFDGGYVGVDVFFVISGCLITSLLIRELQDGRFSFLRFGERRVRRIFPAFAVMAGGSSLAAWLILMPSDLEAFGDSLLAQLVFSSNIYFWTETGYFAGPAETKPLLHAWSLAVEEQFYIVFPACLFVLSMRRLVRFRVAIVLLTLGLSLALSAWGTARYPTGAFFLLPTRAWELMLGALLALGRPVVTVGQHGIVADGLAVGGVIAICLAVSTFDSATPFPGLAALVPCLGAAAVIWAGSDHLTSVGKALALRPLVWIGLISYSLYLWHWPLLVFVRQSALGPVTPLTTTVVLAASFVAAMLSWKYVEQPIRRGRILGPRRSLLIGSVVTFVILAVIGAVPRLTDGAPFRFSDKARGYALAVEDINPRRSECHALSVDRIDARELCRLGNTRWEERPTLLTWGDSHADAMMPALDELAADWGVPAWHVSQNACPPILGVDRAADRRNCADKALAVLHLVEDMRVQHVLLIGRWATYVEAREEGPDASRPNAFLTLGDATSVGPGEARSAFQEMLLETVARLQELGASIWIMRQVPDQVFNVPARLSMVSHFGGEPSRVTRPSAEYWHRQEYVSSVFAKMQNVRFILPSDLLCDDDLCRTEWHGKSLYVDDNHVSAYGARYLKPLLLPVFEAAAGAR